MYKYRPNQRLAVRGLPEQMTCFVMLGVVFLMPGCGGVVPPSPTPASTTALMSNPRPLLPGSPVANIPTDDGAGAPVESGAGSISPGADFENDPIALTAAESADLPTLVMSTLATTGFSEEYAEEPGRETGYTIASASSYQDLMGSRLPVLDGPPGKLESILRFQVSAPSDVQTWASNYWFSLRWRDNSQNESVFIIEHASSADGPFSTYRRIDTDELARSLADENVVIMTITDLDRSQPHCFRIKAANTLFASQPSEVACTEGVAMPLPAPSQLSATALDSSTIEIRFKDNSSDETHFVYELSTSGPAGPFSEYATIPSEDLAVDTLNASFKLVWDEQLAPGTNHCYRVRAKRDDELSGPSNVACATTPGNAVASLDAPSLLTANAVDESTIEIRFRDNSSDETHFEFEVSTSGPGGPFMPYGMLVTEDLPVDAANSSFRLVWDEGLTPGTNHCYRVRATRGAEASGWSNVACATTTQQAASGTTLRVRNDTAYPVISLRINGSEVLPDNTIIQPYNWADFGNMPSGVVSYRIAVGNGSDELFIWQNQKQITANTINEIAISVPLAYLLSGNNSQGQDWVGEYWVGTSVHSARYRFWPNGSWQLFDGWQPVGSGVVTLTSWPAFGSPRFTFVPGGEEVDLRSPFSSFDQRNGPPDWRVIRYVKQ